ncbi:MAG: hypothetical protein ACK47B_06100 [Armatimonadota bacterium]
MSPSQAACEPLFDGLEALDREAAPLGLYASEEYRANGEPFGRLHHEWHRALKPTLERWGCHDLWWRAPHRRYDAVHHFGGTAADGSEVTIAAVKLSKIKVRRFGSAYRVDPQRDFSDRWEELGLRRRLSELWKPPEYSRRKHYRDLVLLIGFAREPDPFRAELDELRVDLNWEQRGVVCHTRSWEDRYDRRFQVLLCAWIRADGLGIELP